MKRSVLLLSVLTALLLVMTGCTGRNKLDTMSYPDANGDSSYSADKNGMTNEYGENGVNNNMTDNVTDNMTNGNAVTRPGTAADSVQDAVDDTGDVMDDIADGAANAVDNATDAIEDAAGTISKGTKRVTRPNSAA